MLALILQLSAASPPSLPPAPRNDPDRYLVSRNFLPDGTVGQCHQVTEARPGWLPYLCETGPFTGSAPYRQAPTPPEKAPLALHLPGQPKRG